MRPAPLALLALACLAGCHRERTRVLKPEEVIAGGLAPGVLAKPGDPPRPPKDDEDAAARAAAAARARLLQQTKSLPPAAGERQGPVAAVEEAGEEAPEAQPKAPRGEARADGDDAQQQGQPDARKPDEMDAAPTTGQPRYFSPKELRRMRGPQRPPGGVAKAASGPSAGARSDAEAPVGRFAPAPTAALDDDVPDSGVADPNEIGSYHVQVATSADFSRPFFDKLYPFMADIDLNSDLAARGTRPGTYYIRYSIVDLLGFEHPFSRALRLRHPFF